MTVTRDDLVEAIAKLNDLTRRRVVVWRAGESVPVGGRPFRAAYTTEFEGRNLRLAEYDQNEGRSEWARRVYTHPRSQLPPRVNLEIVDDLGEVIYEFPEVQGISDLFASARAQLVDVESLIRLLQSAQ